MSTIERALNRKKAEQPASSTGTDTPIGTMDNTGHYANFEPSGPRLFIDLPRLRQASMLPPTSISDRLGNEYRRIKRPLVNNATGRGVMKVPDGNLIMLTSAVQGEGKTFTALNLAMSIARDPDFSVTLVDGDTARHTVSSLLGIADAPGLLNLLADESLEPGSLVRPTNIDSLSVLAAGAHHELSEELLSSSRMASLVAQLGGNTPNHIVLFDAPPVLAAPEAVTLSHYMGQIGMIVKASSTLQHEVTMALEQLDQTKAINMILNQSIDGPGGDHYGGYYGYGYGEER
ncbi:hypothetical protein [Spiribacter vilamensis]|uniref:Exopolysaccharide/PEP-CTERM locus tyrosine autokinase n=2 Tax=Spiribacter vilamensis TaxID=531306 RepID=A0A4Q8CZD6_9GAMM|nr:hypothetical protein [Spiribacter vilamensis]RZU98373.1 exopolysaccharide/PEP-CTERM locus tyrosine autokinase [Spiribacter vilamensis]TVO60745.1 hypothetical protein FPL09_00835 [Spiribacter vilamensis]